MTLASQFESVQDRLAGFREEVIEISGDVGTIGGELRELARAEARLAAAETREQVGVVARLSVAGGIAVVFALLASVFMFLTVMFALDLVLPLWAASLITTLAIVVLLAMSALYARGVAKRISPMPKRTIASIQEDIKWARQQLTSNGR
ncbi:hypothetical protein AYO38_08620 [bacterium SCGC AG-212-C10]|nr:hypothetical protein AYO38_08620 [bacterium SCGC AG-212-C10]